MTTFPTPADFDRALAALTIAQVDDREPEIGPIVDEHAAIVAAYLAHLIEANPALARHLRRKLADTPAHRGVRTLPIASVLAAVRLAAVHGAPATNLEKIA